MSHTVESILTEIKAKKFHSVYFLCGEEDFFIDKIVADLETGILNETEQAFNQSVFYGKDVNARQIIESARRLPMMAERQVVIVKEAHALSFKEEETDIYLKYLQNPVKSTVLIFAFKHGTPDKRKKFAKDLQKFACYLESAKLKEQALPDFTKNLIKQKGFQIEENALRLIVEAVGNDLHVLDNEIEKLIINRDKSKPINAEEVEKSVGVSREYNVFELNNALGAKNVTKAYKIVTYFISNPKNAPMVLLLGSLNNFFLKIYLVSLNASKSDNDLAVSLKVPPFFVKDFKSAAKNYSIKKLEEIFKILEEYDLRSKGMNNNNTTESNLMREMIIKILN